MLPFGIDILHFTIRRKCPLCCFFESLKSQNTCFWAIGYDLGMKSERKARETDIPETIQSLLVAFALALAFRGFVIEGFVIPTGSMAPTLMGQHVRFQSPVTGYEYPFDGSENLLIKGRASDGSLQWKYKSVPLLDPMISQSRVIGEMPIRSMLSESVMGDRVLVLKFLYEFFDPERWDVVVFKNPVDPIGPSQNYIKRLVGVANEQILLADGDVFTSEPDAPVSEMRVQRKPRYIQNAVWQPVYNSDYIPGSPSIRESIMKLGWRGAPFDVKGFEVDDTRTWRSTSGGSITWRNDRLPIRDFNTYNYLRYSVSRTGRGPTFNLRGTLPVNEIRFAAAIENAEPDTFSTELEFAAMKHSFLYAIDNGMASVTMLNSEGDVLAREEAPFQPTGNFEIDARNVDQRMSLEINGTEIVALEYEWNPIQRLKHSFIGFDLRRYVQDPLLMKKSEPGITWDISGTDVAIRRIRVDRDLYYRPGSLEPLQQAAANGPVIEGALFATDPRNPAVLKEDQFLMLGDNSGFSRDSRYWGRPHPLVVRDTKDDSPFIAHRDLLVGKAWSVYFPAPGSLSPGGKKIIPDFGRLRFIR